MLKGILFAPKNETSENVEGYFSWNHCDHCGSTLGGERFDIVYRELLTGPIQEASVCTDCYIGLCS